MIPLIIVAILSLVIGIATYYSCHCIILEDERGKQHLA
jgi:hypothetical protein